MKIRNVHPRKSIPIIFVLSGMDPEDVFLCVLFWKSVCTKKQLQQQMDRPLASYLISWQNQHFIDYYYQQNDVDHMASQCIYQNCSKSEKSRKAISNFQDIASFENVRTPSIYKSSTQSQFH